MQQFACQQQRDWLHTGEPGIEASRMSSKGMRAFQLHQGSSEGAVFGSVRLGLSALDADDRRQLYRQPLIDLQDLASGRKDFMLFLSEHYQKSGSPQQMLMVSSASAVAYRVTAKQPDLSARWHKLGSRAGSGGAQAPALCHQSVRPLQNHQGLVLALAFAS